MGVQEQSTLAMWDEEVGEFVQALLLSVLFLLFTTLLNRRLDIEQHSIGHDRTADDIGRNYNVVQFFMKRLLSRRWQL